MIDIFRQLLTGLRALVALTIVLGIAFPLVIFGISQLAFPTAANGSPVRHDGTVVGSSLIAQRFPGTSWFVARPSANDWDGEASGGSNAGPTSADARATVEKRREAIAKREGVPAAAVPADAVTASGSGLDPDISVAYAQLQAPRVARERGLPLDQVRALITAHTTGRTLGILGTPRVNVVTLNLALADLNER